MPFWKRISGFKIGLHLFLKGLNFVGTEGNYFGQNHMICALSHAHFLVVLDKRFPGYLVSRKLLFTLVEFLRQALMELLSVQHLLFIELFDSCEHNVVCKCLLSVLSANATFDLHEKCSLKVLWTLFSFHGFKKQLTSWLKMWLQIGTGDIKEDFYTAIKISRWERHEKIKNKRDTYEFLYWPNWYVH